MTAQGYLFSESPWSGVESYNRGELAAEVNDLDANQLLNTSVGDLCQYLVAKYQIQIPVLDRDDIGVDECEAQIDVSKDPTRAIRDRSQPYFVPGIEIRIAVPYSGDARMFMIQPPTYPLNPSMPSGSVRDTTLTFNISGTNLKRESVRQEIDNTLDQIDDCLTKLRTRATIFNQQLDSFARKHITERRERLLENKNLVSSLGFKLKPRNDSPTTFLAPEVRRKISPTLPRASSMPYKPEPTLGDTDYEHILEVIENMAQVMERSPSAFSMMDEESLRSHFLVQLNGHYEGQATGETFNYEGRTDILIRSGGKNIFIAECKYWKGPKKLKKTINQLLGYSSWRDTKTAVIVFSRNKDFTHVLHAIKTTTNNHPNCKRELSAPSETSFRFIFSHRDDSNRELELVVMAFDIPKPSEADDMTNQRAEAI